MDRSPEIVHRSQYLKVKLVCASAAGDLYMVFNEVFAKMLYSISIALDNIKIS